MPRLKDRNRQIPNGLTFYQPETKWQPTRFASFQSICQSLLSHRQANAYMAQQHGWMMTLPQVMDEVDVFNAMICEKMGWTDYITADGGQPSPSPFHRSNQWMRRSESLAAGAKTLVDWISSGAEAVSSEKSSARAAICVGCPKNVRGDLTSFFTRPAAEAIRAAISSKNEMKLSTPDDENLSICDACGCVLKLKVHLPLERIKSNMDDATKAELDPRCWVLKET